MYLMNTNLIAALRNEMADLGWRATVSPEGFLKIEENRGLTSPEVRDGERFVWAGCTAKNPVTMAKRLDTFLRSCGYSPRPNPFSKAQIEVLEMAHEAGSLSGNVAAQCSYFDCSEADASGCFDNRCENIHALAEKVGVSIEATQAAFMFGRAGINKLF